MEPYQYIEYSTIFDSLADQDIFPVLHWFINDIVIPRLKPGARVTDLGAGTGYFSSILLSRLPDLKLTLVEPSPEMLNLAKKRLSNQANFMGMTADTAIDLLPQQDAFIFQRSLYVIYQNEIHCKQLFSKLHQKLSEDGLIFIQDFGEKIDIPYFKSYLLDECAKTKEQKIDLTEKYNILEKYLVLFNQGVDSGEFHLFDKTELENLMRSVGFKSLIAGEESCYVFQRVAQATS